MNTVKTALLLGALTGLLMLIGDWIGGRHGVVIAFIIAMVMNIGSYWFSDKIVLRMYAAQEVTPAQTPQLYGLVKELALRAGLPMPRVYIIPSDTPNAFATGRNEHHAVVAVTEGILRILNREELAGVLAHELTHITKPRHAHQLHCRDPPWRDCHAGQHGPVGGNLRFWRTR